ncbi:LysR family transcriptional regulator [Photobacterium sp. 1_MG-2023]|uniref:LysR family transcriptional regulator n=1 Tax=Photobacterium sp. 1_MG-2023 TaxID=3062646 RepID=UPI0026E33A01|nr:LysR family transcriptional regulator [Photobacterium sp. 1_MG-2023]MDO6704790.1 LysR family transcriptional regulator [Photobacterium sp. 1_MG-2023]
MQFSLEQLRAFVSAAETGSFSAAARRLGKAQSVVSTAVSNLETDFHLMLFDRSGKKPRLTPAGEALLIKARRILAHCGELQVAADSFQQGIEPKLTLVVESMAMLPALSDVLQQFEARFPEVEVEILTVGTGDVLKLLKEGRAQLALMVQLSFLHPDIIVHGLGQVDVWCVAGCEHPLAVQRHVDWDDLRQHRQILLTGRYGQDSEVWRVSDSIWRTEHILSAIELTQRGIGWTVLPADTVKDKVQAGTLIQLQPQFEAQVWKQPVDLAWSSQHALGPAGRDLCTLLKNVRLS